MADGREFTDRDIKYLMDITKTLRRTLQKIVSHSSDAIFIEDAFDSIIEGIMQKLS